MDAPWVASTLPIIDWSNLPCGEYASFILLTFPHQTQISQPKPITARLMPLPQAIQPSLVPILRFNIREGRALQRL